MGEFFGWVQETLFVVAKRIVPGVVLIALAGLPAVVLFGVQVRQLGLLESTDAAFVGLAAPNVGVSQFVETAMVQGAVLAWSGFFVMAWSYVVYEAIHHRTCSLGSALAVAGSRYIRLVTAYAQVAVVALLPAAAAISLAVWFMQQPQPRFWAFFAISAVATAVVFLARVKLAFLEVAAATAPEGVSALQASTDLSVGQFWPTFVDILKLRIFIGLLTALPLFAYLRFTFLNADPTSLFSGAFRNFGLLAIVTQLGSQIFYKAAIAVLYCDLGDYVAVPAIPGWHD